MLKSTSFILFIGLCLFFVGIVIISSKKVEVVKVIPTPSATYAKVTRVIDGDTFVIDTGQKVRYIGMNNPELETSECFATEAGRINSDLVLGKEVKLVKDVSETDKYGRLLRFVYVGDTFVDDYLVKIGAARIETVPPDTEFKDEFLSSQNYARQNLLGLWGKCGN